MLKLSTFVPVDPTKYNNLQVGQILHFDGYNNPDYCIIGRHDSVGYVVYDTIDIDTKKRSRHDNVGLLHISERGVTGRGIQMYVTDQIFTPAMVEKLIDESKRQAELDEAEERRLQKESLERKERYIKENPDLILESAGGTVAKNIRIELKKKFPGIKFSVRSDRSSVDVRWEDGPSTPEVKEVIDKYQAGYFDGMEDIYRYVRSDWHIFGSAQYISECRVYSQVVRDQARREICEAHGKELVDEESPIDWYEDCHYMSSAIHRYLYNKSL